LSLSSAVAATVTTAASSHVTDVTNSSARRYTNVAA